MNSDISCIVIQSDRQSGKIPFLGEVVRVEGRNGSFIVMHLDRFRRVAQLMERSGKHRLIDVSFAAVRPIKRNLSQVIRRFLDERDETQRRGRWNPEES